MLALLGGHNIYCSAVWSFVTLCDVRLAANRSCLFLQRDSPECNQPSIAKRYCYL